MHARAAAAVIRVQASSRAVKAAKATSKSNPVTAFFFNQTPALDRAAGPRQGGSNGVVTGWLNGTDGDGDPLTYTVTSAPANGTVVADTDGGYTYTPADSLAYVGTVDSFTITASDAGAGFHIHGLEGLLNLLTFGLLGLSGHTAALTVPVNIAAWKRYNTAPTATATVAAADPKTGTVLGQVIGTDSDGDPLSYTAPGFTAKGAVTIDASTGAFTYTPNASARGIAAGTDTVTVTVTDGMGGSTPITVSVPVAVWNAVNPMIRYTFNFTSGSQYWTADALSALQFAADKLASYIVVTQPVVLNFNVTAYNSPELSVLASAGSSIGGSCSGYCLTHVQSKLVKGVDPDESAADGNINVNFGQPWSFGDTVGSGQFDFVSAMMHELLHAYGFTSFLRQAISNIGVGWSVFDSDITDRSGTPVIDGSYRFGPAFKSNLTGGNGGLYFAGSHAVAANGGLVRLYTPNPWDWGTSASHLNDYTFWGSQLMTAMTLLGPRPRVLSPVEQGVLMDLGYTVALAPT